MKSIAFIGYSIALRWIWRNCKIQLNVYEKMLFPFCNEMRRLKIEIDCLISIITFVWISFIETLRMFVVSGVSIVIPQGAIPEGVSQEIYFKVCRDNNILPPLDREKGKCFDFNRF